MNKSVSFLLFIAVVIISLVSCEKSPETATTTTEDITLSVNVNIEDQPLVLDSKTYDSNTAAEGFRISKFSFYLSEISLFKTENGQTLNTEISDVAYFTANNEGQAAISISNVPVGDYEGVKFNLGLTKEQDASIPADYASGHPLSRSADYWFDWKSYIFMKIEGKVDTLRDNNPSFITPFTFHVGKSEKFAKNFTLQKNITVSNQSKAIPLQIDLAAILGINQGTPVELIGIADHQNGKAAIIMKNAEKAISIK